MNPKCPLCLRILNENEFLSRHCVEHPEASEVFSCTEDNIPRKLFCREPGCDCNGTIGARSVFLRHEICAAKNPFYASNRRIRIPGPEDTEQSQYVMPNGTTYQFTHWEIGMLRHLPAEPEMWFPMMLLCSTLEERNGKRMGVRVELAGSQEVGKTVLAMQAMDKQGYVPLNCKDRSVDVEGFIYSRVKPGINPVSSAYMAALCLRSLHEDNKQNLFRLEGTQRGTGDLKAVFLKPAPEQQQMQEDGGKNRGSLRSKFKYYFINPLIEMLLGKNDSASNDPWYMVSFYDTAGEESQIGAFDLNAIEAGVDKVAVLINASDILKAGGGTSLEIAKSKLPELERKGAGNCCLVVTRMDEILDLLPTQDEIYVQKLVNTFVTDDRIRDRSRELLISWFEKYTSSNDFTKRELKDYLENNDVPVFLIWTNYLMDHGQGGKQPESHGLSHLICWCLGINWKDINQKVRR